MKPNAHTPKDGANAALPAGSLWEYLASHPVSDRMDDTLSVFYHPEYQSSLARHSTSAAARTVTGPSRPEGSSGEPGL
jgi:hypothetical protein